MVTFFAFPRSDNFTASSEMPKSLKMAVPPVRISSSLRVSPWTVEIVGEVRRPGPVDLAARLGWFPAEARTSRTRGVGAWSLGIPRRGGGAWGCRARGGGGGAREAALDAWHQGGHPGLGRAMEVRSRTDDKSVGRSPVDVGVHERELLEEVLRAVTARSLADEDPRFDLVERAVED